MKLPLKNKMMLLDDHFLTTITCLAHLLFPLPSMVKLFFFKKKGKVNYCWFIFSSVSVWLVTVFQWIWMLSWVRRRIQLTLPNFFYYYCFTTHDKPNLGQVDNESKISGPVKTCFFKKYAEILCSSVANNKCVFFLHTTSRRQKPRQQGRELGAVSHSKRHWDHHRVVRSNTTNLGVT